MKRKRLLFPSHILPVAVYLWVSGLLLLSGNSARPNTDMFKPIGSAARVMHINGRGFTIHGKHVFICSGSFHYARVPRALWKNRLLKMKRAGFNTVQTYVFWNFQEPKPGVYDFHGRANLDAFLKLIHKMGMYALVRCGPYDCAEWDDGGYPLWLAFEKGVQVREDDPAFMNPLRQFWNRLLPIVARNQINHGGSVILVQLENEDSQGWGTAMPNQYFRDLYNMAREHGIQVPMFFSGMHHGFDPAGHNPWNDATRTSPWYTTEFWSSRTWYHGYGAMPRPQQVQLNRGIWKIIAFGGSGYNFYMLVGSTNFWLWNDNELAACYDYSAAIGQGGDLRPIYYNMKRANYFARSFANILENSVNADNKYLGFSPGVRELARTGPAGTIVFLDNNAHYPITTKLKDGTSLHVAARAIRPIVLNALLGNTWSIVRSDSRILGVQHEKHVTTVVVYGHPGNQVHISFSSRKKPRLGGDMQPMSHSAGDGFAVHASFPSGKQPSIATAQVSQHILRVLIENRRMEKHTWFIPSKAGSVVVVGPAYAGQIKAVGNHWTLATATPLRKSINGAWVYSAAAAPLMLTVPQTLSISMPMAPQLHAWKMLNITRPAQNNFIAGNWLSTVTPEPMGADDILSPWCWYRTVVTVPAAGTLWLKFSHVSDLASVFINGYFVRTLTSARESVDLDLHPGRNVVAVFTAEHGRTKLYNYLGPINKVLAKGIWGPVQSYFTSRQSDLMSRQPRPGQSPPIPPNSTGGTPGSVQAHSTIEISRIPPHSILYLNGQPINMPQGGTYRATVNGPGSQVVQFRIVNSAGKTTSSGVLRSTAEAKFSRGQVNQPQQNNNANPLRPGTNRQPMALGVWQMHDGAGALDRIGPWRNISAMDNLRPGPPRLFMNWFNLPAPLPSGVHVVLRVSYTGLSSGHIIVNGHDLGLYPDKTMPMGLYIPSVWLKSGRNTVEILDERGHSPKRVRIIIEPAASRVRATLEQN